jgi:cyanophycinase
MRSPCSPKWLILALFICPPSVRAAAPQPADEIAGALVLAGGGSLPEVVRDRFVELAGGRQARLLIIPAADADAADADKALDPWKKYPAASLRLLQAHAHDQANAAAFVKPLAEATGVWLEGGDLARMKAIYVGTAVQRELHGVLARGGVVGATSGGTPILGPVMIQSGDRRARVDDGFGLLPGVLVDPHVLRRNRVHRLLDALASKPGLAGLGIDEETAVVVHGRRLSVLGKSYAVLCLGSGAGRPVDVQVLHAGDQADLIALSRAAGARTQPPFPPQKPEVPHVAKGTLVIGGGGGMPEEVLQQFIEAAGGPGVLIVVIPTALEDPIPAEPAEVRMLRRAGAQNVAVLHTRKRADADSPEFVAPLRKAGGVWFGGGRQWHFVDAYENTAVEKAFHEVLDRGGAIGGSSAGATIQGDYLCRGDPLGNLKIMAEGY